MQTISASISRIGDSWQLNWDGRATIVDPYRGLFYLSLLVRYPNRDISVTALLNAARGAPIVPFGEDVVLDEDGIRQLKNSDDPAVQQYLRTHTYRFHERRSPDGARILLKRTLDKSLRLIEKTPIADMALHLRESIRSGRYVSYRPDTRDRLVVWK